MLQKVCTISSSYVKNECVCILLGSQKSALLRGVVQDEEEEELVDESHDDHVTLNLGSLLQPKLINQQ